MEYLYHYTNLSSLALILKNRTIRFNSMLNMDDAEEVKTQDSDFLGKYCFVSCWTDEEDENIPFWGLYTDNMSGVRIRMRRNPFIMYEHELPYWKNGEKFKSYIPDNLIARTDIHIYPALPFLRKVEYTKSNELIFQKTIYCLERDTDNHSIRKIEANFKDINKYKRECWSFQSEWRYGFMILPRNSKGGPELELENINDLPFLYYDVEISSEAYEDIEILTGPKMSVGNRVLLYALCEKYCPKAVIKESKLLINR